MARLFGWANEATAPVVAESRAATERTVKPFVKPKSAQERLFERLRRVAAKKLMKIVKGEWLGVEVPLRHLDVQALQ